MMRTWSRALCALAVLPALVAFSTAAGPKVTPNDEDGPANFGFSIAFSTDAKTALIGGYKDAAGVGAVWIFTRTGSTWKQQGSKLTAKGEKAEGSFGQAVALSGDGNTALIGGPQDNGGAGAAWVFTRSGSTWKQQAELLGSKKPRPDSFGSSVALSADGNTALVGAFRAGESRGAALVFTRSGSHWAQQGKTLTGRDEVRSGEFGNTAALSADGNTAVVGAPNDKGGVGAAWVFTRSGSNWTQQGAKLKAARETKLAQFGNSVALSSDGQTILVGGFRENNAVGAAWIFTRSGTTWKEAAKLTAAGATPVATFGYTVALSAAGATAAVGAPGNDNGAGAVWVFKRSGSAWKQGAKLTGAGADPGATVGFGVALSSDGKTAAIGGPNDGDGVGAVWFKRIS
jgi:hypothetical protein